MRRAKTVISLLMKLHLNECNEVETKRVENKLHKVMRKITLVEFSYTIKIMPEELVNQFWHEHSFLY